MDDDNPTAAALASMTTTVAATATTPPLPPSVDAYHPHPVQPMPQSPPLRRFSGKSKTGRQSSKFGTVNYSIDEMRRLNEKVRAVMPIAGEDWLRVVYQFNYMRPESIPYREVESLKRKFKKMYCSRSSSVSGRLPEYIEEAKELRRLINVRSEKAQLETSDTHSEVDALDVVTIGLGEQPHQQLPSGKAESFVPPSLLDAANGAAVHSGSSTPSGHQHIPSQNGEVETSEPPATVEAASVVNPLAAADQPESHHDELPQEAASTLANAQQPHEGLPTSTTEQFASEAEVNDSRVIASKLNEMELEYRRTMVARIPSQDVADTAASLVASANVQQISGAVAAPSEESLDSTSGIISMLKHSIERKRRTMEEQMLSESERVRKERKKRKMEQVLYSIHQEQRDRELLNVSLEVTTASILGVPHALGGAVSAVPSSSLGPPAPVQSSAEPSIGMMEIVLQYMVAQQTENERRLQAEQEQRERDQQTKELRRREKKRLRRQERREFMLVMAAALEDKFPASLRQFLGTSSVDDDFVEEVADTVAADGEHVLRESSTTTSSEATEHFESDQPAGSHENESTLI